MYLRNHVFYDVCIGKRLNREFLPNPNRTETGFFALGTEPNQVCPQRYAHQVYSHSQLSGSVVKVDLNSNFDIINVLFSMKITIHLSINKPCLPEEKNVYISMILRQKSSENSGKSFYLCRTETNVLTTA